MSVLTDLTDDLKLKAELLLAKRKYSVDGPPHKVDATAKGGMRSGKISELTVFAPLKPGGADRLRKIIELIDGDFGGALLVGTLHDMRFLFLDDDKTLMFATTFDGDWDVYIEDFSTKIPELLDLIFENVEGFPGIKDPGAKDFILKYQKKADGWFVAYPDQTVNDIFRNKKIAEGLNKVLDEASQASANK